MKTIIRIFIVLCLVVLSRSIHAQVNNVVVFAPGGEKFTLTLGNNIQNSEPAARVETGNPGGPSFKLKVVLADPSIKELSKLVFNKPHGTMFFKVAKNPKGVYVLESTSSEWTEDGNGSRTASAATPPEEPKEKKETKSAETVKSEPVKSGKSTGCDNPISEPDFNAELVGISARPFEPMQLSAAKKMVETHCLMVSQVKLVMYVFNMESSRLSFAKYAYEHTYDRDSYSEVKEVLHSEKSKADLDRYIAEKTK